MTTINTPNSDGQLDSETLDKAFESVAIRLKENGADPIEIVVCGGSALILTGMVPRTTKDVDIGCPRNVRGSPLAGPTAGGSP